MDREYITVDWVDLEEKVKNQLIEQHVRKLLEPQQCTDCNGDAQIAISTKATNHNGFIEDEKTEYKDCIPCSASGFVEPDANNIKHWDKSAREVEWQFPLKIY